MNVSSRAMLDASPFALTAPPPRLGPEHVDALKAAGLGDEEVIDVINSTAFVNWVNRLMISLGEPWGRPDVDPASVWPVRPG